MPYYEHAKLVDMYYILQSIYDASVLDKHFNMWYDPQIQKQYLDWRNFFLNLDWGFYTKLCSNIGILNWIGRLIRVDAIKFVENKTGAKIVFFLFCACDINGT